MSSPSVPTTQQLDWTGERFMPSLNGAIRYEHFHRYAACEPIVRNKRVLDVACGEGYGSAMLAQVALSVSGVDVSPVAVEHARGSYFEQHKNLSFTCASATSLPFETGTFDVVISFETLEHLREQEEMLTEIKRVLRPEGVLVISTPERETYREFDGGDNEFHVKELSKQEFEELVERFFKHTKLWGQRIASVGWIQAEHGQQTPLDVLSVAPNGQIQTSSPHLPFAVYLIAVCSDFNLPVLNNSIFIDAQDDIYVRERQVLRWASTIENQRAEQQTQTQKLQSRLDQSFQEFNDRTVHLVQAAQESQDSLRTETHKHDATREILRSLEHNYALTEQQKIKAEHELEQTRHHRDFLQREHSELTAQLQQVIHSSSWRFTKPIRVLARILRGDHESVLRVLRPKLQATARRTYHRLPISHSTKSSLVETAYRVAGPLFKGVVHYEMWLKKKAPKGIEPLNSMVLSAEDIDQAIQTLVMPTSNNPKVSVIIPAYFQSRSILLKRHSK
jgi:O-antigen biosynthesis protein